MAIGNREGIPRSAANAPRESDGTSEKNIMFECSVATPNDAQCPSRVIQLHY